MVCQSETIASTTNYKCLQHLAWVAEPRVEPAANANGTIQLAREDWALKLYISIELAVRWIIEEPPN
jgi:hypothetical protein